MKPRTLAVLAALVAALGAFVWFYEQKLPSSEERSERGRRVLGLEADEIEGITIDWDGRRVRLERDRPAAVDAKAPAADAGAPPSSSDRSWRLVEPLTTPADQAAANRLADTLAMLEKERTLEDADRQDLGLEVPRARIALATSAADPSAPGVERVLEIGAAIPASSTMVVALSGAADAYVVSNGLFTEIAKAPGEWRSRELFTGQRDAIARLTLASAGSQVLLAKRGESFWLEGPVADRADRDLVNGLLADLVGLRAVSFVDTPPAAATAGTPDPGSPGTAPETGLQPPLATIEVVLEGVESPFRVELGNPLAGGQRYARVGAQVVQTDSRLLEAVERPAAAWRSPLLSGLEVYRVDAAEFTDAQGTVRVERAGPDWRRSLRDPSGEKVDTVAFTPVSDLLYALTSARAIRIAERREAAGLGAAFGQPELTAALTGSDQSTEEIRLFPDLADGSTPALVSGRESVLILPPETAPDVAGKLEILRRAEPLPEKEDQEPRQP